MINLQNLNWGEEFGFAELFEWGENISDKFPYHCKLVQFSYYIK